MRDPSSAISPAQMLAQPKPVNEELVVAAIAGVIHMARSEGQTLAELKAQVLKDEHMLDRTTRKWLSDLVVAAWQLLPERHHSLTNH